MMTKQGRHKRKEFRQCRATKTMFIGFLEFGFLGLRVVEI
jgi:hypothetical protein